MVKPSGTEKRTYFFLGSAAIDHLLVRAGRIEPLGSFSRSHKRRAE